MRRAIASAVGPLSPVTMMMRMPAVAAAPDGVGHLRPGRVAHAHQRRAARGRRSIASGPSPPPSGSTPARDREHAQRVGLHRRRPPPPRAARSSAESVVARQHDLGGALDVGDPLAADQVDGRHALALGAERAARAAGAPARPPARAAGRPSRRGRRAPPRSGRRGSTTRSPPCTSRASLQRSPARSSSPSGAGSTTSAAGEEAPEGLVARRPRPSPRRPASRRAARSSRSR